MHHLTPAFIDALNRFGPISLAEMDDVQLLRRKDIKYLMSEPQLLDALVKLAAHYDVLAIAGQRSARYETLYFDHAGMELYFAHHSGKIQRHKVRKRAYVDSGLAFLEVKLKQKGMTDKRRLRVAGLEPNLSQEEQAFVAAQGAPVAGLKPSLFNRFDRITLVNKARTERLTLDWNIAVAEPGAEATPAEWSGVCIAELKQSGIDRLSPFAQWAKGLQIRPERVSKYCIGLAETREGLKANRFKAKRRKLSKLTTHAV